MAGDDGQTSAVTTENDAAEQAREEIDSLRIGLRHYVAECEIKKAEITALKTQMAVERNRAGELLEVVRAAVSTPRGLNMLRRFIDEIDTNARRTGALTDTLEIL